MNVLAFPLHFLRPWWWLALAPMPVALWMLARGGSGRAALARLADAALLPYLVHDTTARGRWMLGLVAATWLLAVAALSGPAWQKVAAPLYVNGAARVVALSLSDDMLAQDVQPDRMTRARFAVRDLLDSAGDARTALVAYAGAAFTVAPLTDDKRTVLNLLRMLQPNVMPVPGNDAAAGIGRSVALLQQAHVRGGEIVLVTDTADAAAVRAARAAHADGIRVDVLGIGTKAGAPVPRSGGGFVEGSHGMLMAPRDDAALRAVAQAGGGDYAVLSTGGVGASTFTAPTAESGQASSGERAQVWRDGGIWLLPVLLVLAALAFRRGWLLTIFLLALPIMTPAAHAATWDALWANRDQRAAQALRQGDPATARALATTPAMRGAADYRAGDYANAAKAFARGNDARSRYDLGNALAKQGEYGKAIAAYRQALQRNPHFADARANLAAVEAWLKHHPPPASPQSGRNRKNTRGKPGDKASSSSAGAQSNERGEQRPAASSGSPKASSGSSRTGQQHGSGTAGNTAARQQGVAKSPAQHGDQDGASAQEDARQQAQARQAARGIADELKHAARAAGPHAFALGQAGPRENGKFDAQQRAILNAVPDDPGALLRRKFQLEWEQRNDASQGGQ
jgi:Ca-activated chloride channel homolog